jgi:hypothetical protein
MVNPAINVAVMAAQQQAKATKVIFDQLLTAGATSQRAATKLKLGKGDDKMLAYLVRRGHVREAGGGRYWLDKEAVARTKARGVWVALILTALLVSGGASLLALAL